MRQILIEHGFGERRLALVVSTPPSEKIECRATTSRGEGRVGLPPSQRQFAENNRQFAQGKAGGLSPFQLYRPARNAELVEGQSAKRFAGCATRDREQCAAPNFNIVVRG